MRLRNITGSREFIAENKYVVHEPEKYNGCWNKEIFENGCMSGDEWLVSKIMEFVSKWVTNEMFF